MFTVHLLCILVDGLMERESSVFVKRLMEKLSVKWNYSYGRIFNRIRTQLTYVVLSALCHHSLFQWV